MGNRPCNHGPGHCKCLPGDNPTAQYFQNSLFYIRGTPLPIFTHQYLYDAKRPIQQHKPSSIIMILDAYFKTTCVIYGFLFYRMFREFYFKSAEIEMRLGISKKQSFFISLVVALFGSMVLSAIWPILPLISKSTACWMRLD